MFKPKNILVPIDFTGQSKTAIGEAIDIAKKYGSHIFLLHVIDQQIQQCADDYCLTAEEITSIREEMMKAAKERLDREIAKIKRGRTVKITGDVRMGDSLHEILDEEKTRHIDLVVTSPHTGKGLLSWLGLGLAERLVKNSGVETLVVH